MPRKSRELIGSVLNHNMVQGINREYIFQNDKQKMKYLNLLKKYSQKYKILMIAYCIMDNHSHVITYSENIKDISLFMKEVNAEYAIYYNKTNNRIGYVFRNRFNSKPIYDKEYLLRCIKYIHMNPVKAGISNREDEYEFSSYKDYLNHNGIINSKLLKIVFNQEEEYMKIMDSINYESLNLEKEKINLEDILEKFLSENNVTMFQIRRNSILIKKFISYLISNEYEFKKQDIAKIIKISRTSLYRKLNNINESKE